MQRDGVSTPARRLVDRPASMSRSLRGLLILMRPRQWVKNALVLAGPLFGSRLFEPDVLERTLVAFAAMCLVSSAGYVFNDLRDAARDRAHPQKSRRPVASGVVSERAAATTALVLLLAAVVAGYLSAPTVAALVAAYAALMLLYSVWGRGQAPLDVFIIASGFLIRALAGAAAAPVDPSPWFLALTVLLALMLGFGKRRAELSLLGEGPAPARTSLSAYTPAVLDQLLSVLAASIIVLYAIYAVGIGARLGTGDMILTWPLVLAGIIRYLQVSHTTTRPPDELLVSDRVLLALVLVFALVAGAVLRLHTHLIAPFPI
ncbi:MAG: hypothetical protein QOE92_553 [Chloroflexota bacterium]|jgi:4-hydroxybenzoate polyprenyltransferase|nr:hypothetical protein [Chloroflexota bacterium]